MRLLKGIMTVLSLALLAGGTVEANSTNEINERDIQAVKQFIRTKRDARLSDKHDNMNITGDVRFEYQHKSEEINGVNKRGNAETGAVTKGANEFDVEVNLYFEYETEKAYARVKIEFDNDAGIDHSCGSYNCGSGQCDQVCLETAYIGYRLWEEGDQRVELQLGRRNLYAILDSRVQFNARHDGLTVNYFNQFDGIGSFQAKGGIFVVDSLASNWAYYIELALSDIADTGLEVKYSYIDWTKNSDRYGYNIDDVNSCPRAWNFRNSQILANYFFEPDFLGGRKTKLYGAFLINHAARGSLSGNGNKENIAFYLGGMIGKVKGEGDWSIDVNYQYVEAQAVAEFESSGIGRGNSQKRCFSKDQEGNTNFHGFLVEGLYGITDNLKIDLEAEFSWDLDRNAGSGDKVCWAKWEAELIYSF